jgi:hypothetical protein
MMWSAIKHNPFGLVAHSPKTYQSLLMIIIVYSFYIYIYYINVLLSLLLKPL